MKKLGLIFALGMIVILSNTSFAQNKNHNRRGNGSINKQQTRQENRIQNGVQNGSLTPKETQRLERREARISDLEAKDRASNGGLSTKERVELNGLLKAQSAQIYEQKHDAQGSNSNPSPNPRPGVNQIQTNQTERIQNGVQNGSLTAQETYRLERQEARISDLEAKDRASGGKLSKRERAELTALLKLESHRIYVQKHDGQGARP